MIAGGLMFAGTPDQVFEQLVDFYEHVGGFGNLLMMAQAGTMGPVDTAASLTLLAREVLPRLSDHMHRRAQEMGQVETTEIRAPVQIQSAPA
jgi:hypothetical protein